MKDNTKLALRPDFTFSPDDLVMINGAVQLRPGQPAQAALDLRPPAPKGPPWADASATEIVKLNWAHSKQMHAKMEWITENVPGHRSLHKIMDSAITAYVEDLIVKYYKPEP